MARKTNCRATADADWAVTDADADADTDATPDDTTVKVHFINNAGDDVYINVTDLDNAQKLVEELHALKIPATVYHYWA